MNENLQILCERFIENRDALRKAAPLDSSYIYPSAANTLTAAGVIAEQDKLKAAKKVMDKTVSNFSYLRGLTELPFIVALYLSEDAEATAAKINSVYKTLKTQFGSSEYLALLAIFLYDLTDEAGAERIAARAKTIYKRMNKEHPFLTNDHDSIMAGFMALSGKSDDDLLTECEACFQLLKETFSDGQAVQTCAQILSIAEGTPEEKINRMNALLKAIEADGKKFSRHEGLPVLAALSLNKTDIATLSEAIAEIDNFLAEQKGYGLVYCDKKTRLNHAAMLTATAYGEKPSAGGPVTVSAAALAAAVAEEAAACAAVLFAAAASSI